METLCQFGQAVLFIGVEKKRRQDVGLQSRAKDGQQRRCGTLVDLYHAASMIRGFLRVGFQDAIVRANVFRGHWSIP
jgi:hypothetical protein